MWPFFPKWREGEVPLFWYFLYEPRGLDFFLTFEDIKDDANDFFFFFPALVLLQFVMTEVFAGINHRLSEVYGNIELPNQDSKAR